MAGMQANPRADGLGNHQGNHYQQVITEQYQVQSTVLIKINLL
jgi:hypothetical protein